MKTLRKRLALLATLSAMALGLGLVQAAPAQAAVVACSGHITVASHTTAGGNTYTMQAHLCGDDLGGTSRGRVHWHCFRNGVSWDGCRVNSRINVQFFSQQTGWTDGASNTNVSNPGGSFVCQQSGVIVGFFADSTTSVSNVFDYVDGSLLRTAAKDDDSMRFCLADGSTVVKDVTNAVSGTWHQ